MPTLYHSPSITDNRDYDQVAEIVNTLFRKFEIEHGMINVRCVRIKEHNMCRISGFWKSNDEDLRERLIGAHPEDIDGLKEES